MVTSLQSLLPILRAVRPSSDYSEDARPGQTTPRGIPFCSSGRLTAQPLAETVLHFPGRAQTPGPHCFCSGCISGHKDPCRSALVRITQPRAIRAAVLPMLTGLLLLDLVRDFPPRALRKPGLSTLGPSQWNGLGLLLHTILLRQTPTQSLLLVYPKTVSHGLKLN